MTRDTMVALGDAAGLSVSHVAALSCLIGADEADVRLLVLLAMAGPLYGSGVPVETAAALWVTFRPDIERFCTWVETGQADSTAVHLMDSRYVTVCRGEELKEARCVDLETLEEVSFPAFTIIVSISLAAAYAGLAERLSPGSNGETSPNSPGSGS